MIADDGRRASEGQIVSKPSPQQPQPQSQSHSEGLPAGPPPPPPPPSQGSEEVAFNPKSINNVDYQQIVASLIDMRVDLKLEIQKLSNRVNKIDEHIA